MPTSPCWKPSAPALFALTTVAEITGCYLPYLWLKQDKSAWLLVPAAASLRCLRGFFRCTTTAAGRVYAAYGGVYIGVAVLWLWAVDGIRPTATDWIGVAVSHGRHGDHHVRTSIKPMMTEGRPMVWERMRQWARRLKRDGFTLWFAMKDPRTPWYVKGLAVAVVAYALSPIDLIPNFIPVLGYLDDVILLPGLIWLTLRMLRAPVLEECRAQAELWMAQGHARPRSMAGAIVIALTWMLVLAVAAWYFMQAHTTAGAE